MDTRARPTWEVHAEKIAALERAQAKHRDALDNILTRLEALENANGSRLPENWEPDGDDLLAARRAGLSNDERDQEAIKYRDHWTGCTGQKAFKKNWNRTWANWCSNAARYRNKTPQDAPGEPEASTEGKDTSTATKALYGRLGPEHGSEMYGQIFQTAKAIRKAFCAKRDRDLHILAACSDSIPEVKRFMPMLSDKADHDVHRHQATIRTQLDAISMDLGYGPIQWPRSS